MQCRSSCGRRGARRTAKHGQARKDKLRVVQWVANTAVWQGVGKGAMMLGAIFGALPWLALQQIGEGACGKRGTNMMQSCLWGRKREQPRGSSPRMIHY